MSSYNLFYERFYIKFDEMRCLSEKYWFFCIKQLKQGVCDKKKLKNYYYRYN